MFCPQCKAEYRQGFTRCADCDVDLVYALPTTESDSAETSQAASPVESSEDPFCSFWKGDDPRIHAELCSVLDDAGIPHKTVRRQDHLFNLSNYPAFQIGVPFSLYERAEEAVKEAFGTDEERQRANRLLPYGKDLVADLGTFSLWLDAARGYASLGRVGPPVFERDGAPESVSPTEESGNSRTNWDPDDWRSEDATVEVWADDETPLSDILVASLRENQIHARFEKTEGENAIFVLPEDEKRAREIVREIVEGAPPA